jgi:hypothetical protein
MLQDPKNKGQTMIDFKFELEKNHKELLNNG